METEELVKQYLLPRGDPLASSVNFNGRTLLEEVEQDFDIGSIYRFTPTDEVISTKHNSEATSSAQNQTISPSLPVHSTCSNNDRPPIMFVNNPGALILQDNVLVVPSILPTSAPQTQNNPNIWVLVNNNASAINESPAVPPASITATAASMSGIFPSETDYDKDDSEIQAPHDVSVYLNIPSTASESNLANAASVSQTVNDNTTTVSVLSSPVSSTLVDESKDAKVNQTEEAAVDVKMGEEEDDDAESEMSDGEVSEKETEPVDKDEKETDNQEDEDKRLKCNLCPERFSLKKNLKRHRLIHSIVTEKDFRFKCDECNRKFHQQCDLKRHMHIHDDTFPYRCGECGKGYIRKRDLEVHKRFHTKERPFKCEHCPKAFYQSGDLKRHTDSLHLRKCRVKCGHCTRSFAKEATLIRHIQVRHKDEILESIALAQKISGQNDDQNSNTLINTEKESSDLASKRNTKQQVSNLLQPNDPNDPDLQSQKRFDVILPCELKNALPSHDTISNEVMNHTLIVKIVESNADCMMNSSSEQKKPKNVVPLPILDQKYNKNYNKKIIKNNLTNKNIVSIFPDKNMDPVLHSKKLVPTVLQKSSSTIVAPENCSTQTSLSEARTNEQHTETSHKISTVEMPLQSDSLENNSYSDNKQYFVNAIEIIDIQEIPNEMSSTPNQVAEYIIENHAMSAAKPEEERGPSNINHVTVDESLPNIIF